MILIGTTGPAGAGKDTAADYLVVTHGFVKLSWAAPMKSGLAAMGFPEPANRDDKEKLIDGFPFSWREAAQKIGTEWGRALDPEMWIKLMGRQLMGAPASARFVISDVRFENEAAMIRQRGGTIIHLDGRAVDLGANAGHASEAGIVKLREDFRVVNDQTLQHLFNEVDAILYTLQERATS